MSANKNNTPRPTGSSSYRTITRVRGRRHARVTYHTTDACCSPIAVCVVTQLCHVRIPFFNLGNERSMCSLTEPTPGPAGHTIIVDPKEPRTHDRPSWQHQGGGPQRKNRTGAIVSRHQEDHDDSTTQRAQLRISLQRATTFAWARPPGPGRRAEPPPPRPATTSALLRQTRTRSARGLALFHDPCLSSVNTRAGVAARPRKNPIY
jgi:hypothetical protein